MPNINFKQLAALFFLFLPISLFSHFSIADKMQIWLTNSEQVIDKPADLIHSKWSKSSQGFIFLSPQQQGNWLKLTIHNPHQHKQQVFLRLSDSELPSAHIYQIIDDTSLQTIFDNTGLSHRFDNRPVQYRRSVFPLTLEAEQELQLLVHLQHQLTIKVQPKLWQESEFMHFNNQENIFAGMLYGMISMVIIYCLLVFITIGDKNYLQFILFALFAGLFISMKEGHFYQFILADKTWSKEAFSGLAMALMCFSFTLFSATFLDLKKRSPLAKNLLHGIGFTLSLFILLLGLNQQELVLSHFVLIIIALLYFCATIAACFVWRHYHSNFAAYFAFAISLANTGLLLDFYSQTPSPFSPIYNYGYASMGYCAMLIMFAFILAYKLRILQKNESQSNKELLRLNQEAAQQKSLALQNLSAQKTNDFEQKEAQLKSRLKSEFIANISADIRTPMNSIFGLSDLLASTELDAKQRYYIESISTSAHMLFNTINSLVDYSQIQTGSLSKELQVFSLADLVDECISIFALQTNEAKVFFTGLVNPETPLQYRGYPDQLRQILLNILANAIRLEQLIGISLRVEATGRDSINSKELRFSVICHGALLSEEKKQNLLTPFDQEGDNQNTNDPLPGLALSLQLAEYLEQDAQIGIETNEDEQYTRIWLSARLWLPNKEQATPLPDYEKLFSGRRMLICDPHPSFTYSIKILTESWGMKTVASRTQQETLQILNESEQSFQILMIAKEDLDNELLKLIQLNDKKNNTNTAIIAITRTRFAISQSDMHKLGIHALIEKPWTSQQLINALRTSLGLVEEDAHEQVSEQRTLKALIAEDNNINLMVLEGLLSKRQLNVTSAESIDEVLERYQNEHPPFDLIFVDCDTAESKSYKTSLAIRETEKQTQHKSVIIGLSAHTDDEYEDKALASGMDEFIVKPINPQYIDDIISNVKQGYYLDDDDDSEIDNE